MEEVAHAAAPAGGGPRLTRYDFKIASRQWPFGEDVTEEFLYEMQEQGWELIGVIALPDQCSKGVFRRPAANQEAEPADVP